MRNLALAFLLLVYSIGYTQGTIIRSFAPTAADADGIVTAVTVGGASNEIGLTGALVAGASVFLTTPAMIGITSAADNSALVFTVTGTNRESAALVEYVTGANASVAYTTKNFKMITQLACSAATTGNISIGPAPRANTSMVLVPHSPDGHVVAVDVVTGGVAQHKVQGTFDEVGPERGVTRIQDDLDWWDFSGLSAAAGDTITEVTAPVKAVRLYIQYGASTIDHVVKYSVSSKVR